MAILQQTTFFFIFPTLINSIDVKTHQSVAHASHLLNYPTSSYICDDVMRNFSSNLSAFVSCAASNARPITVCQQCVDSFQDVSNSYKAIVTSTDESQGSCNDYLLNGDRVQVVRFLYDAVLDLWTSLDCSFCFTSPDTATSRYKISEDAQTFNFYVNETFECMRRNTNVSQMHLLAGQCPESSVCKNCSTQYDKLNAFYNGIYARGDSLCMDLVDLMNTSRTLWSKKYSCVHRKNTVTHIFVVTLLVLLLPVAFYFGSWIQADKQEQSVIPQKRLIQAQTQAALAHQ